MLLPDTIDCFGRNVANVLRLSDHVRGGEEVSPDNYENLTYDELKKRTPMDVLEVSWLSGNGEVGKTSGPNWGMRDHRNKNEAYLPYLKDNQKQGFFPDKKQPEDKHCSRL